MRRTIFLLCFVCFMACNCAQVFAQESLGQRSEFNIAVFRQPDFPVCGVPEEINAAWIYNSLREKFLVTYIDFENLCNPDYLIPDKIDLLILPYGENFPFKAFYAIRKYLEQGGGFLNLAGRPFWKPLEKVNGVWQEKKGMDSYTEFLAPLGIKYYQVSENRFGLTVTTSLKDTPVIPSKGNIFPYRIQTRDFFFSENVTDQNARDKVVFVKSWKNSYDGIDNILLQRWALIPNKGKENPLMLPEKQREQFLIQIVEQLSYPVVLYDLETNFSAYHPGEKVSYAVKAFNCAKHKRAVNLEIVIFNQNQKIVYRKMENLSIASGVRVSLDGEWKCKKFKDSFYTISVRAKSGVKILDKVENGFVVIDQHILKNGPLLQIKNNDFYLNNKKQFLCGVNYYESKIGELLWVKPNILKIKQDFEQMRSLGINFVRIHYHHSKWFRDYFTSVLKNPVPVQLQKADKTSLPSERSLRILDAVIQLSQENGIIFCADLFTLVPQEMGNPIGWLGLRQRITDKGKIAEQKKFIKIIASRYQNVPGITWDLWNEPRLNKKDLNLLRAWIKELKVVFRKNGDNHLLTVGGDLSLECMDSLDYASIHTYKPLEISDLKKTPKPFIFQEVWNEAGCSASESERQAENMRTQLADLLHTEAKGFMPWQWTRQARLWNCMSEAERWDDELGCCVYGDGVLKPAGEAYADFIRSMRNY